MNIITRKEWGAEHVNPNKYSARGDSRDVVVHHTAETLRQAYKMYAGKPGLKWFSKRYLANKAVQRAIREWQRSDGIAYAAECKAMREHQHYHIYGNGWTDIGYHFVIFPSGRVYEGRPEWARGSHALNGNHMVGISFAGNYEKDVLTPNQVAAYQELLAGLHAGRAIGHYRVPGNSTASPGRNIKSKLGV